MDERDRPDPSEDSELSPSYLTLLQAIEQTMAAQKMIESMQVRQRALRGQMAVTKDEEILQALQDEEDLLMRTMRLTGFRVAKAVEFFEKTKIVINGKGVPVTQAAQIMRHLKNQAEQFVSFEQQVEIYTGNDEGLEDLAKAFSQLCHEMGRHWALKWSAFVGVMEGVRVKAADVTQFEIGSFEGSYVVEAVWSAANQRWEVPQSIVEVDTRITEILNRLNQQMMMRIAEDGVVLRIVIRMNAKGDAKFECDLNEVTQPNFRPFHYIISDTSSTGGYTGSQ